MFIVLLPTLYFTRFYKVRCKSVVTFVRRCIRDRKTGFQLAARFIWIKRTKDMGYVFLPTHSPDLNPVVIKIFSMEYKPLCVAQFRTCQVWRLGPLDLTPKAQRSL